MFIVYVRGFSPCFPQSRMHTDTELLKLRPSIKHLDHRVYRKKKNLEEVGASKRSTDI